MKLALMNRFYVTVDDEGRSPILDTIISRWFDSAKSRVIRASANFVARVDYDNSIFFLRFNHEDERSMEHIRAEMKFIHHIIGKGVNANKPVISRNGKLVETVKTELGLIHAILFEEVPGEHIESDDLDVDGFRKWGEALGKVHKAGEGLVLEGAQSWRDHVAAVIGITPSNPVLVTEAETIEGLLGEVPQTTENYGIIPFDFEMDNIKWVDGSPGFMDFDDFCSHWYAADIAYALRDLHGDRMNRFDPSDERVRAFIVGYRGVKDVSDAELERIPVFIRLHNLYFYYRIQKSIEDDPEPGEPDWVGNLRGKLRSKNGSYLLDITENPLTSSLS